MKLFPTEVKTVYYSPFQRVTNSKGEKETSMASGCLLDHFNYIRKGLIKDKILVPTKIRKAQSEMSEADLNKPSTSNNTLRDDLEWLICGHLEPQNEVFENWQSTFDIRRDELNSAEPPLYLNEILDKFPCLKMFTAELVRI